MLENGSLKDIFILLSCQIKKKIIAMMTPWSPWLRLAVRLLEVKSLKKLFKKIFFIFFINIYNKIGRNYVTALRLLDIKG